MTDFGLMKERLSNYTTIAKDRAESIVSKSKFLSDEKADAGKVIEFAITVIIVAAIIPAALVSIFGANQSSWDTATIAIWGILGVIIVAIIVLMLYNTYGKKSAGGGKGGRRGGF